MDSINAVSNAGMTAYQGIQQNFNRLADNTQTIIQPQQSFDNTANALIDNKMAQTDIEALVKVLKTEDLLLGQLLDIKA
ncbi:hypothetical protein J3998_03345 [Thiomicrorhabdus sp. 6S2-11]|uniref:Flagellar basal-body/hook protein C-terminal domain-containing protein n=1 Tax=Thiomicrorhabdus marina TaxID=2818442 RepID=A0ABS3Q2S9_9GAMM|nr:hypothetical protein [Thiomicrorhabdus marina]MBO1926601.1 hypothetical protein [Thiomicrorhabdus marina]